MLNQAPRRWKASAKVEQNIITTKHTTNFFYAKTKIISEMARFSMQRWQNKEIKQEIYRRNVDEEVGRTRLRSASDRIRFFSLTIKKVESRICHCVRFVVGNKKACIRQKKDWLRRTKSGGHYKKMCVVRGSSPCSLLKIVLSIASNGTLYI